MDCLDFLYERDKAISLMNGFGAEGRPFCVFVNFRSDKAFVFTPEEMVSCGVRFSVAGQELGFIPEHEAVKATSSGSRAASYSIVKTVTEQEYGKAFEIVENHISHGDTYLLNLTFPTELSLEQDGALIYERAKAVYKGYIPGKFIFYSPERFVRMEEGKIRTYPMKGTFRYRPGEYDYGEACEKLLNDRKELYEHYTIVDLLRNDLAMVSSSVHVPRFRYVERFNASGDVLLQTSSEIEGSLPENWKDGLGDIVFRLLPAGSICGAPKKMTLDIIEEAEIDDRGFYTGICGYFDGKKFDSGVMIRFMELGENGKAVYRSGGGITCNSKAADEYAEMIDKIYIPQ